MKKLIIAILLLLSSSAYAVELKIGNDGIPYAYADYGSGVDLETIWSEEIYIRDQVTNDIYYGEPVWGENGLYWYFPDLPSDINSERYSIHIDYSTWSPDLFPGYMDWTAEEWNDNWDAVENTIVAQEPLNYTLGSYLYNAWGGDYPEPVGGVSGLFSAVEPSSIGVGIGAILLTFVTVGLLSASKKKIDKVVK